MSSSTIIEALDVPEDILKLLQKCLISHMVYPFGLKCADECLCTGVIPADSFTAHAAAHLVLSQFLLIFVAAVL